MESRTTPYATIQYDGFAKTHEVYIREAISHRTLASKIVRTGATDALRWLSNTANGLCVTPTHVERICSGGSNRVESWEVAMRGVEVVL